MNTQPTLTKTKSPATVPVKPTAEPQKGKDEILERIAEDCLVDAKAFVEQSKAPEGE